MEKKICSRCKLDKSLGDFHKDITHRDGYRTICKKCLSKKKDITINKRAEFINKGNLLYEYKYDYSNVIFVNTHTKVSIICPEHGLFYKSPNCHINSKSGCSKCVGHGKTDSEIITQFNYIHNKKYDYSKMKYVNNISPIILTCPIHGDFKQKPVSHKQGNGCSKCAGKYSPSKNEIMEEFILKHSDKYIYPTFIFTGINNKIPIICRKHGEFKQSIINHRKGQGCPICKTSKGENCIRKLLTDNLIKFNHQHSFNNCKYKNTLSFDFYLPELNTCIEYNGRQHYQSIDYFGGEKAFKSQQKRDAIKIKYCKVNNINLIIIRYNSDIIKELTNHIQ